MAEKWGESIYRLVGLFARSSASVGFACGGHLAIVFRAQLVDHRASALVSQDGCGIRARLPQ